MACDITYFDPVKGTEIVIKYSDILNQMSDSLMNLILMTGVCFIVYFMMEDDSKFNFSEIVTIGKYSEELSVKGFLEIILLVQSVFLVIMAIIYKTGANL